MQTHWIFYFAKIGKLSFRKTVLQHTFTALSKTRKMKVGNPSDILNGIWAIEKSYADAHFFKAIQILKGQNEAILINEAEAVEPRSFINDNSVVFHNANAQSENSILALDLYGVVTKYDQFSGGYGMQTFASMIKQADKNPNIKAILLYMNSGGGSGYAAMEMVNAIKAAEKPTVAFIDDLCASAMYWIASACDHIIANTEMAQIGSIGTYSTIADFREQLKMEGINLIDVYAEKSSEKNLDYKNAIDGDTKLIQEKVNKFNENFSQSIRSSRGDKLTSDVWEKGNIYFADKALEIGLIDEINTIEYAINSLKNL